MILVAKFLGGIMSKVSWRMHGEYMKNCNCIATCPCDTVGFPYPDNSCEGMAGMHILYGHFGDVLLDGLNWAVTYRWPGALHEGNGSVQPLIDERASEEQRAALLTILSGQAGDKWFEVLAAIVTTVHEPQFVPIEWQFDKAKRQALLNIPGFLTTTVSPLTVPADGSPQRVIVRMPDGMEYKEFEVAQATLEGTGAIQFKHSGRHSSLAHVTHSDRGLIA
jgi:hypothetical protein